MKKEVNFEEIFPSIAARPISVQEEHFPEDDTCSVTSLETTSSSRIPMLKGNRWTFKVRSSDNLVYVHIQQLQFNFLTNAVKEKLSIEEPFSLTFRDAEGDMVPIFNDDDLVSLVEASLGSNSGLPIESPLNIFVNKFSELDKVKSSDIFETIQNTLVKKPYFKITIFVGVCFGMVLMYRKIKS